MMFVLLLILSSLVNGQDCLPQILRSFPSSSLVTNRPLNVHVCTSPLQSLSFLQGTNEASLYQSACTHNTVEHLLICKLGMYSSLSLNSYPLSSIETLILFVQEHPFNRTYIRTLDLCFLTQFSTLLKQLAICSYEPPYMATVTNRDWHIVDVPTLAACAPQLTTLLIYGLNLWQSVELRQFDSLKHLAIFDINPTKHMHTPYCSDCAEGAPIETRSFHYLIPLESRLDYFLYQTKSGVEICEMDLLKIIFQRHLISTLIISSVDYMNSKDAPVCNTCASRLCPPLSVCLEGTDRRDSSKSFECLCVKRVDVEDEFTECQPLSLHHPIYSSRCNLSPPFRRQFLYFLAEPLFVFGIYATASIFVLIISTLVITVH